MNENRKIQIMGLRINSLEQTLKQTQGLLHQLHLGVFKVLLAKPQQSPL